VLIHKNIYRKFNSNTVIKIMPLYPKDNDFSFFNAFFYVVFRIMKELQKVRCRDIGEEDGRFCFRDPRSGAALQEALSGFVPIPLLWWDGGQWIPLFPVEAESPGNGDSRDALVYPRGTSYEDVLWDLVRHQRLLGEITLFDIAGILALLQRYVEDADREIWGKRLGIGAGQWEDYLRLREYGPEWSSFFMRRNAPLKRVMQFRDREMRQLLRPLLALNPGINIIVSIAHLLTETARRERCKVPAVWEKAGAPELLRGETKNAAEVLAELRARLYRLRYPLISEYRRRLEKTVALTRPPGGIRVDADPFFERPGFRLTADMEERETVDSTADWLNGQRDTLKKIMDIQEGRGEHEE
jgi:hypothetical protein